MAFKLEEPPRQIAPGVAVTEVGGAGMALNVNVPALVTVQPEVTEINPVADDPIIAVIDVLEFTTKEAAFTPPNSTAVTVEKFVPVMDTASPGQPLVGEKLVMVGTRTMFCATEA